MAKGTVVRFHQLANRPRGPLSLLSQNHMNDKYRPIFVGQQISSDFYDARATQ